MDLGSIITTREEFIAKAGTGRLPISKELAKSLLSTTKHSSLLNLENKDWFYIEKDSIDKIIDKVRAVDEKVKKMNKARLETGKLGGRPLLDDKTGTPAQVKARIAKRRSRDKLYENNT